MVERRDNGCCIFNRAMCIIGHYWPINRPLLVRYASIDARGLALARGRHYMSSSQIKLDRARRMVGLLS
jgi:hypothetical protein